MESIEIKGFLTIDHAHLEIKKINILIGAQAQGKSVIAKLVYFFKRFFPEIFIPSIKIFATKKEIDKKCFAEFENIFPRYTWVNQEFSISYQYENYDVSIVRAKENNKFTLKFNYSKELSSYHRLLKNTYRKAVKEDKQAESFPRFYEIINVEPPGYMIDKSSFFIPAGRSFFANLQKNIFSFLARSIDIDPLIKAFGSHYEQVKRIYQLDEWRGINSIGRQFILNKVDNIVNDIVKGEYIYANDQDWISNKGKRTNLANASSGQQESLPMLLILKTLPFMYIGDRPASFFIEEPEAHLFPTSQKQIISLIATIYNATGHAFFITTHSPYILTAINNLVVGQDAYDKAKASANIEQLEKLAEVLPTDELIRLEDVSAYTLNNGKIESIVDLEDRLIGANLLDSVSDEFDAAFSVAIDVLYGGA